MASTKTPRKSPAPAEPVGILDRFRAKLVSGTKLVDRFSHAAILSTVILGETLAAMFDVLDDATPPVKADAKKSEHKARKDSIMGDILKFVQTETGHFYTPGSVTAWMDAARVNATLPEHLRVTVADGDDAIPVGTFGTWPLRALGRIEDLDVRASLAETLASEGITTQDGVESAVKEALGTPDTPRDPIAARDMTAALVKKYRKSEAGTVGKVEHIALSVGTEDSLELSDFGRSLWTATPSDSAETDPDKRKRKRLEVFRAAAEQILDGIPADTDDGAEAGSEPVL